MKKIKDVELKDNRNLLTKAVEFRNKKTNYEVPLTLGRPKKDKQCLAMDACIRNVLHGFTNDLMYAGAPKFLGYAMLSNISQEALIRAGVDTVSDECTRKFYKLRYVDEKGGDHEDFINEINEEAERLHLKKVFNRAFKMTGYYGGCLGYIDVGDIDDEEKKEPLILDKKTIKKGMIKGIKLIEPINIYPGYYNTTDPTADDYFVPQSWYVLGKEIHASRFLYFSKNEAPLLLKPAYNFFGIPDAQLVLDYVAHFVENRESAQELLHKFSLTCFGTDMAQQLQGASFSDLKSRIGVLNKFRNNNGTFVFDKEKEEITQLNTPLGGVREIVDMSLNLLCAIFRIPKIRLLGEGEGGLNASSVEQTRVFYDYINATKEVMARNPLTDAIKLCQLNLGYEPDENLKIDFPALWEMDDKEKADLNKTKADRDIAYINAGVLSQEEVRQSLSLDCDSGYDMIDAEEVPENFEQNMEEKRFGFEKEKTINEFNARYGDDEIGGAEDSSLVEDSRWITIHPNGEEEKGRHLLLEGEGENQETPAEAMKRQWGVNLKKKEEKKDVSNQEKQEKNLNDNSSEKIERLKNKFDALKKTIPNMSKEDLVSSQSILRQERKDIQDEIHSNLYKDKEYSDLIEKKDKILKVREELYAQRDRDISRGEYDGTWASRFDENDEKLREVDKKIDEMINNAIDKRKPELDAIADMHEAIEDELRFRRDKEQKEKMDKIKKEKEEKAKKGKELAKKTYYPETIAGVKRGKDMSFEQADSSNPNPNFGKESGYGTNCQSCVVCYEARLRGYDVSTAPNKRDSKLAELSHETNKAWIDPETGLNPEYIKPKDLPKTAKKYYNFLNETIKKGERYTLGFAWKGRRRTGHIVSIDRDTDGYLRIYDPQSGKIMKKNELFEYLGRISYRTTFKMVYEGGVFQGGREETTVELTRVDNMSFNPEFMNDIMEVRK